MVIGRFLHKGLRRLYEDDDPLGLPNQSIRKIKAILFALESAESLSQVATFPGWRLHSLKGSRKGDYSITVTGNWRITFRVHGNTIRDLNYEDYH